MQVSLDILNGRQLSHIRRTRASEHLVRNASDAGRLACFLEDPEKEIVGVDRGAPRLRKNECIWGRVFAGRSPPLQFCIDRNGKPDTSVAALLSKSFAAARCLEATQGESSLLELHARGEPR